MKRKILTIFVMLSVLISVSAVYENNEKSAIECLNNTRKLIDDLENDNFSTDRLEYIHAGAIKKYEIIKETNNSDFSNIIISCNEISNIVNLAYTSRDSFRALEDFYKDLIIDIKAPTVDEKLDKIKDEIRRERYELIDDLIKEAYDEIILIKSRNTALVVFYAATTKTLGSFLKKNWERILIITIALIITLLILNKTMRKKLIEKKLKALKLRKETLKGIIKQNQDDYFNKGIISEEAFYIRNSKLGEMVRDIDRQIPLLLEQKIKLKKQATNKKK